MGETLEQLSAKWDGRSREEGQVGDTRLGTRNLGQLVAQRPR